MVAPKSFSDVLIYGNGITGPILGMS